MLKLAPLSPITKIKDRPFSSGLAPTNKPRWPRPFHQHTLAFKTYPAFHFWEVEVSSLWALLPIAIVIMK